MTLEELKSEAKLHGYKLVKNISEKWVSCKCGCNRRTVWHNLLDQSITLECKRCGAVVNGKNLTDAKRNWNRTMRGEKADG